MPLLLLFSDGKQSFGDELHHWKWNEFFWFWTFKVKMKEKWKKVLVFTAKLLLKGKKKWWAELWEYVGEKEAAQRLWLQQDQAMEKYWPGSGFCRGLQCEEQEPAATANHWAKLPSPSQPWLPSSLILSLLVRYGSLAGCPTSPWTVPAHAAALP